MKAIGIRELKAHLSRVLEDVRRGEVVLVTERGRVVAELRRPRVTEHPDESPAERALSALAERGEVRLGARPRPPVPAPSGVKVATATIDRLLADSRGGDDER